MLYDYKQNGENPSFIDDNGQVLKGVKINRQVTLDSATAKILSSKIGDYNSYGQARASCFEPHLAILYYLNGKVVIHVLVCMGCNVLYASIDILAQHQNKRHSGSYSYYAGQGMSKSFRQFLNKLLVKYSFSHQIEKGSMFDK